MYTTRPSQSSPNTIFLLIVTAIVIAAGAVIVLEAGKVSTLTAEAGRAANTFGLMLVSLAGVVLSVILPERLGKALLFVGALGFFACLGFALLNGVRF